MTLATQEAYASADGSAGEAARAAQPPLDPLAATPKRTAGRGPPRAASKAAARPIVASLAQQVAELRGLLEQQGLSPPTGTQDRAVRPPAVAQDRAAGAAQAARAEAQALLAAQGSGRPPFQEPLPAGRPPRSALPFSDLSQRVAEGAAVDTATVRAAELQLLQEMCSAVRRPTAQEDDDELIGLGLSGFDGARGG
eukprot:3676728-Lingulodinium_polyedra.AAC.1